MASAVAPPTTPKTTTSVDPLYSQAIAQAKAALAAETAPVQAEQAASDASYAQRQTDATGNAAALSDLLKGIAPATQGIYQNAEQNQELAANGFSHGMQDALQGNADNLNAMLDKLGSPAKIDSHAQQAGDVLYGLGGYIPGETFNREGAAFGAAAAQLPGTALLRGQENVKDLQAKAIVADQGFQQKIAEMAGKLPGDVQANYSKLQSLALQDAKFRQSVAKDKVDAAYKQAQLKLATAKYNTDVAYKGAQLKLSGQRLQLAAQKFAREQFTQDRAYGLQLAKLGIQQKSLQLRVAADAFKQASGGFSQKEITKFTELANGMANDAFHGRLSTKTTGTGKTSKTTTTQTGGVPYFQALGGMMKRGIPVQLALEALDRVYPQNARPTQEALLQNLGPLSPDALIRSVQGGVQAAGRPDSVGAPGYPSTDLKREAFQMASHYGWSDVQNLSALDQLWTRESGWNPNARNPTSGAAGIPQELGHQVPAGYFSNPTVQLQWGLNYIKQRYGSPANAWAHEQQYGWY